MIQECSVQSLTILLVEDNPLNALIASRLLTKSGHTFVSAADGKEALEALLKEHIDLVLMDLEMPDMDGMETTRRIRDGEAGEENRSVPIIAMTAHRLNEVREKCKSVGMNNFITKPVDFHKLNALIQQSVPNARGPCDSGKAKTVYEKEQTILNKKKH